MTVRGMNVPFLTPEDRAFLRVVLRALLWAFAAMVVLPALVSLVW